MSDEFWGWFDTINHLENSTNPLVSNRWSIRYLAVSVVKIHPVLLLTQTVLGSPLWVLYEEPKKHVISLWMIWYFAGQMCSMCSSHGDVRYCYDILWWLWVIHGHTIYSPLCNPFTNKKGGSYVFWSLLMVGSPSLPFFPFPLSPPGLEEDDARSSVRWMLDACERRFANGAWRETFMAWVQRRARREPVQYIVGSAGPSLWGRTHLKGILGDMLGIWGNRMYPQWILVFLLVFWFSKHIHTFEHILGSYECNGI